MHSRPIVVVVVPFVIFVVLSVLLAWLLLFFIASFTPIADVRAANAPQSENFNYYFQLSKMVLYLFQLTFPLSLPLSHTLFLPSVFKCFLWASALADESPHL